MLEGKEIQGKIGNDGSYSVDVDETGSISIEVSYEKDLGDVKVKTSNSASIHLFTILEKAAAKTGTPYDDKALAMIKTILGIK